MEPKRKRVYVDVNVFLNPILYKLEEFAEATRADDFLKQIINGRVEAYTSLLSWNEFVWVIRKLLGAPVAIEKGREFWLFPNLTFENITQNVISKAQELIETHSIKPRDAIHLATMLRRHLTEIISFDADFKGIQGITYHAP